MGKALALASVMFIVLGTYYGGQRGVSEVETRRSVSDSQYETLARNGALAGMNLARQALAECFVDGSFDGISEGVHYKVETAVSGDLAKITSTGGIMGAHDKDAFYTVVTHFQRWGKNVPFEIVDIETIPEVDFKFEAKVIGSEISYGGTYDMPVTVRIEVGESTYEPFGNYESQNHGVEERPSFIPSESFAAGTPISISARSWFKSGSGWDVFMEQDSRAGDNSVVVLRDGDDVPGVAGLNGQASVGDLLEPFTENGKIDLSDNQSIYLFELGSSDPSSAAYDMQDLVVLIDLSPDANDTYADGNSGNGNGSGGKGNSNGIGKNKGSDCGGYELRLRHYNES
ncbi:MAG: hypothetical protein KJO98_16185 [Rhodothermia bacterium]|nr:hypothetical protein [Rhodothermia bacterium]